MRCNPINIDIGTIFQDGATRTNMALTVPLTTSTDLNDKSEEKYSKHLCRGHNHNKKVKEVATTNTIKHHT
jgi:hypothetical protein